MRLPKHGEGSVRLSTTGEASPMSVALDGLPEAVGQMTQQQWLFQGRPRSIDRTVAGGSGRRLLGYRWPDQAESDDLDSLADDDGIVCLPSVLGERAAADRLRGTLGASTWRSRGHRPELVSCCRRQESKKAGPRSPGCRMTSSRRTASCSSNRPFVWHIWDGRRDGFGALVNYHPARSCDT